MNKQKVAIVAGSGPGLGMSLCRKLIDSDYFVAGLTRSARRETELGNNYLSVACDLTQQASVNAAITEIENSFGLASVYIHNASDIIMKEFLDTSPGDFTALWEIACLGAIHGIQRVLPDMLENNSGTIVVTGATASIKAGAKFSAFGSAKFALRGLVQSLAREYGPQGIHFAHVIIDGVIWSKKAEEKYAMEKQHCLLPDSIAESYLQLVNQDRSAWTQELDLRPDVEVF